MSTVVKDLGAVSAYAYAVEKGYTGTEAEFAELMADYANVGQRAEDAADSASESKSAAQTAATTATNKASEATTAAQTATTKAGEAQASAQTASSKASEASTSASTASAKATESAQSASQALTYKTDAESAKTASQTAQGLAESARDLAQGYANDAQASAESISASASQIATNTADISALNADLTSISESTRIQFPDINGVILPPLFRIGSRYVNNGADKWATNTNRISFKSGTYISLKAGDVVTKTSDVYVFGGGYSTNNGSTWTAISNTYGPYTAPADGLYFFNLAKPDSGEWTETDAQNGWKYISFKRSGSIKDTVETLANDDTLANVKDAIGYELSPEDPTALYTMTNTGKGLNYLGNLVDESVSDTSDYIELTSLFYDVFRIVSNTTKYGLGSICYYTANKTFIQRVQPGTDYEFTTFNGEVGAWLGIDKTIANAKYIRFTGRNDYGFKYWVVYNGYKAAVLDQYKKLPLYGKTIVNFGDSIFGNTRPPKDISSYLAELTGATVYNAGFGGCEMSTHASADYTPFSMCSLADAVATGTWTDQETNAALSGMPSYFAETVTMLKGIDFSNVDIVTIGYGTNDWNNGSPLDNSGNTDKSYFADALRYSIETLLTAYPNLRIFVCTQTYRFFMDANYDFTDDCTTHTNSHGKTLTDFVDKTAEVAAEYNRPCINNYNIGINRYSRSQYFSATDGTHPTYVGNQLIAHHMANELY